MCGDCEAHKKIDNEWTCSNPASENYGLETEYTDDCEDCVEKGE